VSTSQQPQTSERTNFRMSKSMKKKNEEENRLNCNCQIERIRDYHSLHVGKRGARVKGQSILEYKITFGLTFSSQLVTVEENTYLIQNMYLLFACILQIAIKATNLDVLKSY